VKAIHIFLLIRICGYVNKRFKLRRGLIWLPELLAAGENVAFGHDDIMDPWYPMGSHDMLEGAHMGAHCLQMM
jgi:cytosine/adenosine deaminase-related metal-dependent hydrolase